MARARRKTIIVYILLLLLTACTAPPLSFQKGAHIAVWNIEDVSPLEEERAEVGELLSSRIIETLQKAGDFSPVERERLDRILEELNLGTSAVVDESTCLRIGRLAGAQMMIFGGYQVVADQMRLDLRLVEVETGRVVSSASQHSAMGDLPEWLEAAGSATRQLFEGGGRKN